MATVGTAYVIVRALTQGLRRDIGDAVNRAASAASSEISEAGERIGTRLSRGIDEGMSRSAPDVRDRARSLGEEIGDAIGGSPDTPRARNAFRQALTRVMGAFRPLPEGTGRGQRFVTGFINGISSFRVPPQAWLVALAIPALGGAVQLIGAYLAGAVSLVAAIGPAIAGAAVVGIAGLGALVGAIFAVTLALKANTPAMAEFRSVVASVSGEFRTIGEAAQRSLLPGIGAAVQTLTAAIPALRTGMSGIAAALGGAASHIAGVVVEAENLRRLEVVLGGGARVGEIFGRILGDLYSSFLILAEAGQPLLVMFTQWIEKWSAASRAALEIGASTGTLAAFMERAGVVAAQLGQIIGSTLGGLAGVFSASSESGQTLLDRISAITAKFDEWANSIGGQQTLSDFFSNALPVIQAFNGLIGDAFRMLGESMTGDQSGLLEFINVMRTDGLPAIQQIAQAFATLGPQLVGLISVIAQLFQHLADTGVLGAFVVTLQVLISTLNLLLGTPVVGSLVAMTIGFMAAASALNAFLLPFGGLQILAGPASRAIGLLGKGLGILGTMIKGLVIRVFPLLITGIRAVGIAMMTNPIGLIIGLIALLVTGLIIAYQRSETFRNIVNAVGAAIMTGLGAALEWLLGVWDSVWGGLVAGWAWIQAAWARGGQIIGQISDAIGSAWQAVVDGFNSGVEWVRGLFERLAPVFDAISQPIRGLIQIVMGVFQTIKGIFTGDWDAVVEGISNIVGGVVRVFAGLPSRVIQMIAPLLPGMLAWLVNLWNTVSTAVANGTMSVLAWFGALPGRIWDAIVAFIPLAGAWMASVFTSIWNAIVSGWNAMGAFWRALPGNIWNAIVGFVSSAGAWMASVFSSIWSAIVTGWNAMGAFWRALPGNIWNAIVGFIDRARAWGSDVMGNIRNAISNGIPAVIAFFTGLPGRILAAIGNLGSTLLQSGKDLIQGLLNGINNMWNAVVRRAKELASAVGDAIGDALALGSPSRMTTQFGEWVGEGLVIGMRRLLGPIRNAAAQVASAATPRIGAPGIVAPVMGVPSLSQLAGEINVNTARTPAAPVSLAGETVDRLAVALGRTLLAGAREVSGQALDVAVRQAAGGPRTRGMAW